jgi:four helix bundle protein
MVIGMNKKNFRSFEDLDCWKACTRVRRYVMELIKKFPKEEKFSLTDDMKRASRSTTHNIAERFGRFHFQENVQFCRHSRGSLYELVDQFITANDEGYITLDEVEKGKELISNALQLLNGYINYLVRRKEQITNNK